MSNTTNTFNSMKPNMKESYAGEKKKKRFNRLNDMFNKKGPGAVASENPMKALKDKSYLNLKGKKGIAV